MTNSMKPVKLQKIYICGKIMSNSMKPVLDSCCRNYNILLDHYSRRLITGDKRRTEHAIVPQTLASKHMFTTFVLHIPYFNKREGVFT